MDRDSHLNDKRMSLAAIDLSMLKIDERSHLENCSECSGRLASLVASLGSLGEMSRHLTPPMASSVNLEYGVKGFKAKRVQATLAISATIAFAAFFILIFAPALNLPDRINLAKIESNGDDTLINEVSMLLDNPLPEGWSSLNYGNESILTAQDIEIEEVTTGEEIYKFMQEETHES